MRYEMLGPLRITDGDRAISIGARKIEVLLVALLTRADQVVASDQLISEIWGDNPPRRATAGLHVYVSQLRKILRSPHRSDSPIVTWSSGYLFRSGPDEIDSRIFSRQVNLGRMQAQEARYDQAAATFEAALALWRGPVPGDLPRGPILNGLVTWLTEARLECVELLIDTQLMLGRHRELIGRLYSLAAEHPLREAFYRQLMLALYRSERQADALKVYQAARGTLNRELGLEPCRSLRELQLAILTADDRLDIRRAGNRRGSLLTVP